MMIPIYVYLVSGLTRANHPNDSIIRAKHPKHSELVGVCIY